MKIDEIEFDQRVRVALNDVEDEEFRGSVQAALKRAYDVVHAQRVWTVLCASEKPG